MWQYTASPNSTSRQKGNSKALHLLGLTEQASNRTNSRPRNGSKSQHSVTLSISNIMPSLKQFQRSISRMNKQEVLDEDNDDMNKKDDGNGDIKSDRLQVREEKEGVNNKLPVLGFHSLSNPVFQRNTPSSSYNNAPYKSGSHSDDEHITDNNNVKTNKLKDVNSNNNNNVRNINEAVRSLNVLAQHGFYSTQNINNIYQLKKYLS